AREAARVRIDMSAALLGELRQDLSFEWKPTPAPAASRTSAVSAADRYERKPANAAIFEKASHKINKKHYDEATSLIQKIVAADPRDFQAWTELGNTHLLQKSYSEAEIEYLR